MPEGKSRDGEGKVRGTCREIICLHKKSVNKIFSFLLFFSVLSYANITSAREAHPRTQFTIMGGKLRSANHCIIGEYLYWKDFFSSFLHFGSLTIFNNNVWRWKPCLIIIRGKRKSSSRKKRKVHDRRKEAKVAENNINRHLGVV